MGFPDIARPNAGSQPVFGVVGFGDEIVDILEGMAVTTGPKISSRTTFIFSFVLTSTVGLTK